MSINHPHPRKIPYAEYVTWPDEPRHEIIDGIPYMQAAPSRQHQRIVTRLTGELYSFLKGKPCDVYVAPFDVRLSASEDDEEYYVVQPDISVICDNRKLDDKGCKGAPDMIAEVLSPSTWRRDKVEKLNAYQQHRVKEYILIYPNEQVIEQYILKEDNTYSTPYIYKEHDMFHSHIFPEFKAAMSDIFS